jgi:hypothetical protein
MCLVWISDVARKRILAAVHGRRGWITWPVCLFLVSIVRHLNGARIMANGTAMSGSWMGDTIPFAVYFYFRLTPMSGFHILHCIMMGSNFVLVVQVRSTALVLAGWTMTFCGVPRWFSRRWRWGCSMEIVVDALV